MGRKRSTAALLRRIATDDDAANSNGMHVPTPLDALKLALIVAGVSQDDVAESRTREGLRRFFVDASGHGADGQPLPIPCRGVVFVHPPTEERHAAIQRACDAVNSSDAQPDLRVVLLVPSPLDAEYWNEVSASVYTVVSVTGRTLPSVGYRHAYPRAMTLLLFRGDVPSPGIVRMGYISSDDMHAGRWGGLVVLDRAALSPVVFEPPQPVQQQPRKRQRMGNGDGDATDAASLAHRVDVLALMRESDRMRDVLRNVLLHVYPDRKERRAMTSGLLYVDMNLHSVFQAPLRNGSFHVVSANTGDIDAADDDDDDDDDIADADWQPPPSKAGQQNPNGSSDDDGGVVDDCLEVLRLGVLDAEGQVRPLTPLVALTPLTGVGELRTHSGMQQVMCALLHAFIPGVHTGAPSDIINAGLSAMCQRARRLELLYPEPDHDVDSCTRCRGRTRCSGAFHVLSDANDPDAGETEHVDSIVAAAICTGRARIPLPVVMNAMVHCSRCALALVTPAEQAAGAVNVLPEFLAHYGDVGFQHTGAQATTFDVPGVDGASDVMVALLSTVEGT